MFRFGGYWFKWWARKDFWVWETFLRLGETFLLEQKFEVKLPPLSGCCSSLHHQPISPKSKTHLQILFLSLNNLQKKVHILDFLVKIAHLLKKIKNYLRFMETNEISFFDICPNLAPFYHRRLHNSRAILETCDLRLDNWDTDYISVNWEQQYW